MAHRTDREARDQAVSRRGVLKRAAGAAAASVVVGASSGAVQAQQAAPSQKGSFTLCLNTSTIRGQDATIPLPKEIELAAKAGFTAMEPWVREIDAYVKGGGDLKDLRKRFEDSGV